MALSLPWKYSRRALPRRQIQVYTMLGLTLFALTIFGAFAIRPTLMTVTELRRKIADEKLASEKLSQKVKDLSQAHTKLATLSQEMALAESALPREKDLPPLLDSLTAAAEKNHLRLKRLSFEAAQGFPVSLPNRQLKIEALPFIIQVEGNFPDFMNFLAETETGLRLANVEEIRISNRERGSESYNLKLSVYAGDD